MKSFQILIISFLILVNSISIAFCQDITLSWDPSPTPEVTGYYVYYKQGDMHLPFDGTGADQGPSPVTAALADLTIQLTGLTDGVPYYFAVTAFNDDGQESTYSNIVSNSWLPALLAPDNGATNEPIPATFRWETAPSGYDVTYTLYYGTDQNDVTTAGSIGAIPPAPGNNGMPLTAIIVLATLLIVLTYLSLPRTKFIPQAVSLLPFMLLGALLTACGSGGGGEDSSSDRAVSSLPESVLYSVEKGSNDYHQAYDLEASTTYYWKVVATDALDPNLTYESEVKRFTTEE